MKSLNFTPTRKCIPTAHIVVEAAITQPKVNESLTTRAYTSVIGTLSWAQLPPKKTLPSEMKAVRELAKDKYAIILPAEKGRSTVVMDCSEYHTKVQALRDDWHTYQPLTKDPTGAQERRMNIRSSKRRITYQMEPTATFAGQEVKFLTYMAFQNTTS